MFIIYTAQQASFAVHCSISDLFSKFCVSVCNSFFRLSFVAALLAK